MCVLAVTHTIIVGDAFAIINNGIAHTHSFHDTRSAWPIYTLVVFLSKPWMSSVLFAAWRLHCGHNTRVTAL